MCRVRSFLLALLVSWHAWLAEPGAAAPSDAFVGWLREAGRSGVVKIRRHRCQVRSHWRSLEEDGVPTVALFFHPGEDDLVQHNAAWNHTCVSKCPFYLDAWMRHHTALNDHIFLIEGGDIACLQRAHDLCINHVEFIEPSRERVVDVVAAALPQLSWLFSMSIARYALMALVLEVLGIDVFVWLDLDVLAFTPSQRLYEEFFKRRHHEVAYCIIPGCEGEECLPLANNIFSLFTYNALIDIISFIERSLSLDPGHPVFTSDMHMLFSYAQSAAKATAEPFCTVEADLERCMQQVEEVAVPDSIVAKYLVGNTCSEWDGGVSLDTVFYGYGYLSWYGGLQVTWRQGQPYVISANGDSTPKRLWSLHFNGAAKFLMDTYSRPFTFYDYSRQDFCSCTSMACSDCTDPWHFRDYCVPDPQWAQQVVEKYIYPEYERYMKHLLKAGNRTHKLVADRASIAAGEVTVPDSQQLSRVELFRRNGFVALRSQFGLSDALGAREMLDRLWDVRPSRPAIALEVSKGMYKGNLNSSRMLLTRAPLSVRAMPYRMYIPLLVPELQPILYNESLLEVLRELVGAFGEGEPSREGGRCEFYPTRGLLFERGSQQELHDDAWYSLAHETPGGTLGVWFAFDDVDGDNGPLVYLAGSHLRSEEVFDASAPRRADRLALPRSLPPPALAAHGRRVVSLAENAGTEEHRWFPRTGDVGIWHERLLHGGVQIRDMKRTRRSLVVHYKSVCGA